MKKLLSIVLVCIFLALALASCGGCAHNFSGYRYTESGHYAVCILCGEAEGAAARYWLTMGLEREISPSIGVSKSGEIKPQTQAPFSFRA